MQKLYVGFKKIEVLFELLFKIDYLFYYYVSHHCYLNWNIASMKSNPTAVKLLLCGSDIKSWFINNIAGFSIAHHLMAVKADNLIITFTCGN